MSFNQLVYFVETIRCSSINKAARKLDVNPSTLLSALNSLETELECSLLVRSSHGVQPTQAGEALFKDSLRILDLKERWTFLKHGKSLKRQIDLLVIPAIYNSVFGDVVHGVTESDPEFVLNIRERNTFEIENALSEKTFSIALTTYLKEDMSYIHSLAESLGYAIDMLRDDHYMVLVRKDHPLHGKRKVALEDLKPYAIVDSFNKTNFKFGLHNIFNAVDTIYINEKIFQIEHIAKTDCFGLVPSIMKHNALIQHRKMRLLALDGDFGPISYIIIYPEKNRITSDERFIVNRIKDSFMLD